MKTQALTAQEVLDLQAMPTAQNGEAAGYQPAASVEQSAPTAK